MAYLSTGGRLHSLSLDNTLELFNAAVNSALHGMIARLDLDPHALL